MKALTKEILIDAIVGRGVNSFEQANDLTELGLIRFSGNQWNESWTFIRAALEKLSMDELVEVYKYEDDEN